MWPHLSVVLRKMIPNLTFIHDFCEKTDKYSSIYLISSIFAQGMRKSVTNGGNLKNNTLTVPAEKRNGIKKKAVNMRPSLEIDKIDLDAIR